METIQYTVRNVPPHLDRVVRERATREGRSVNAVLVDALKSGLGLAGRPMETSAFDDLSGSWKSDPKCEAILDAMRETIDTELWK